MNRPLFIPVFLFLMVQSAFAVTVLSTDSGTSKESIKEGVSEGIVETVAKHAADWLADGMDKIGDWALQTLFKIYDKYIGTFLIKIPDLASPRTYMALSGSGGNDAVSVVLNILKITSGTGLFLLILGFVIDTGQRSSGLWDRVVEAPVLVGFVAAFLCLFGWPSLHSFLTNAVTAMGYYIYNQNTLQTSGVLQGFQNIDLDSQTGSNVLRLSQIDFRGNFITSQGMVWNLAYLVSMALVILGFYNCYSAASAGDSRSGNYRFFQAVAGVILILGVPTLIHALMARGADSIGNRPVIPGETLVPFSVQGAFRGGTIHYPAQNSQAPDNKGIATASGGRTPGAQMPDEQAPDQSRIAKFSGGLLKCGVSIWGLIICFAVIFAKFFQVLNLWVLFVLGPIFIGCLGHPATAPIFWGALRYFVKLLLYSVVWAITLVGLYLIPNIDWGVETIGVNSLLTAVAILAGLQLIANVQEFASLFTTFSGANLKGDGLKEFSRDTQKAVTGANTVRLGAFGALQGATGETTQGMVAAAGAFAGSIIPGVGTAGGALAGQRTVQGMNALAKLGSIGGKPSRVGPDNPVTSFLKKASGGVIADSLKRDSGRDLSPSEAEKRKLVGDYAKKLQGKKDYKKPGRPNQGPQGSRSV